MKLTCLIAVLVLSDMPALSQDISDDVLATRLSDHKHRGSAVSAVRAAGRAKLPILLSWSENAPPGVDVGELYIGLADAFGELRAKEAIPFLIRYMTIQRTQFRPNIWEKTNSAIEEHFAAVGALIRLGPEASRALMKIPWQERPPLERLAAIFIVARIGDPEAHDFLVHVRAQAIHERELAEEGLKLIGSRLK